MALFKVTQIIDGDTIKVSPNWVYNEIEGDTVKIFGYSTPLEMQQSQATKRLNTLLLNNSVELVDARKFNPYSSALLCRVVLNGVDIAKYFPEFGNSIKWDL